MPAGPVSKAVVLATLTVVYFVVGKLSLELAFVNPSATPVWPPAGLALAALVLGGYRLWPAVLLGAFLVNVTTSSAATALPIAVGNTLEALIGAVLLVRLADGARAFYRARGVMIFVLVVAVSTLVAATIGTMTLVVGGYAKWEHSPAIWLTWWLGDFCGDLTIAPLLVLWAGKRRLHWTPERVTEAFLLFGTLCLVAFLIFGGTFGNTPLGFFCLPHLVWAAYRFGPRGAATSTALISAIAVAGTVRGAGPFAVSGANESLLLLQAFTAVCGLTSLMLAAVVGERETVRDTLEVSETRYRALAEAVPVFLFTNRPDGACDYVSPQFYVYTGAPDGAALGDGWGAFIHPEDRQRTFSTYLDARREEKPHESEQRMRSADGQYRWFRVRNTPLRDTTGTIVKWFGVCFDIHERKTAEAELDRLLESSERARVEAEAANRAKDEFLAMLGHELRNPLSAVRNALLASRLDASSRDRALEIASRQAEQLSRLVDDLLDVARVSEGKIPIRKERVLLADVVERALEATRPLFEARGHFLPTVLRTGDVEVEGDPARLEQVAANLLGNAAKFTETGGRIDVIVERRGDEAVLRVRDEGIGIPAELLGRIFDPFVQGERGLDRAQGGLGIGLTLVRRIAELHGGRAEARSRGARQGAELSVMLPVAPVVEARRAVSAPSAEKPARGIRVLVVEDNVDSAESLAMLLQILGHHADVRHDGPSGLAAAKATSPDLILIDIGLPGIDGYELARRARDAENGNRRVVLVALTGYGRDEDKARSVEAGFDHHLVKPVQLAELQAVLAASAGLGGAGAGG